MIDLHIHSNISDGELSPKDIINQAKINGVTTLSIADHDNINAYTKDFLDYANYNNINIIPAVEISSKLNGLSIHILGYNFNICDGFKKELENLRNIRHEYLDEVTVKLKELGYILNNKELHKIESVTKAHIYEDIISNKLNIDVLIKTFNHIPNKGEFIENILNKGCPGYVKKETISPTQASLLIKKYGGKVILAHPVAYTHQFYFNDNDIIDLVKDIKADGIEANYLYMNKNGIKINEIDKWNQIAKENNFITTIGSDFHDSSITTPFLIQQTF